MLVTESEVRGSDIVIGDVGTINENHTREVYTLDPIRCQCLNVKDDDILEKLILQEGSFFGWFVLDNKLYRKEVFERSNKCLNELEKLLIRHPEVLDIILSVVIY